jgi:hypothetical protein
MKALTYSLWVPAFAGTANSMRDYDQSSLLASRALGIKPSMTAEVDCTRLYAFTTPISCSSFAGSLRSVSLGPS